MKEQILAYETPAALFKLLRGVTEEQHLPFRLVTNYNDPIGVAAGELAPVLGRTAGPPPGAPMLVLCGLSEERLDHFLDGLKRAGLSIPFKAVLTETNKYWLPGELFVHMLAEREEIRRRMEKAEGPKNT